MEFLFEWKWVRYVRDSGFGRIKKGAGKIDRTGGSEGELYSAARFVFFPPFVLWSLWRSFSWPRLTAYLCAQYSCPSKLSVNSSSQPLKILHNVLAEKKNDQQNAPTSKWVIKNNRRSRRERQKTRVQEWQNHETIR